MGITEDMWKNSKKIDFGKELSAAEADAKAWKTIWSAGQGVTSISDSPTVKDLVEKLKKEFIESIEAEKNPHFCGFYILFFLSSSDWFLQDLLLILPSSLKLFE